MTETAHIFHPKDDSLEARIEAYRNVHQAWLNAEASLRYMENEGDDWRDIVGEREDVARALDITAHSLYVASDSFTRQEISEAKNRQLISESEALDLIENKLQSEMRSIRESQSDSHSSSQSHEQ